MREYLDPAEVVDQLPAVRKFQVSSNQIVEAKDWGQVHRDGFTWEGNLYGFIEIEGNQATVAIHGRDMLLADHLLAYGEDVRFGHPVTETFQSQQRYIVHPGRMGVAIYFRDSQQEQRAEEIRQAELN